MKYFVFFLVLIGSSGLIVSQAYGAYVEFEHGKDKLLVNNEHIVDFQLNWNPANDLPSGKITFGKPINETLLIQIPKNIPRTMNLDFGSSLYAIQTDGSWEMIRETDSLCFYILEIPVTDSDYLEIESVSVATGRWEPVAIDNEECNDVYDKTIQNEGAFPHHGPNVWEMPPQKQIKNGVALVDVRCNEGKTKVVKHDRMSAACVTSDSETYPKLIDRGWATMRFHTEEETSAHALCNNYQGKWHPEHDGCRGDISDLQCSLMGGKFIDNLKICYNDICPKDKTYTLCVTNSK